MSKIFILVCFVCILCLTGCGSKGIQGVVDLSDDEVIMLECMYNNKERIESGKLFDYQLDNLERYRLAKDYMLDKYPDCSYEFINGEPKSKLTPYAKFYIEDDSDTVYQICVKDNFVVEDNFYASFFESQYEDYIVEYLRDRINGVIEVSSKMPFTKGVDYGFSMEMSDIISGEIEINTNTIIHIIGSCESDVLVTIRSMSEDCNLYGSYIIYFYRTAEDYKIENYSDKETFQYFKE